MKLGSLWGCRLSCACITKGVALLIVLWEEESLGPPCGSGVWQSITG